MSFSQNIETKLSNSHIEGNELEKAGPASNIVILEQHETDRRLLNKLDCRIVPSVAFVYLLCYLDRSNIGNAKLLNSESGNSLMKSLSLTDLQYTITLMTFLIAFVFFEVPSNYCLKRFGPSRWIAFLMFSWGAITISLGTVQSYGALVGIRFLLGAFEAQSRATWAEAKRTLLAWPVWAHAVATFTISVPFSSLSLFSPTIVAGLGYKDLDAQLFTVPPYACAYFVTLSLAWFADRRNQRSLVAAGSMLVGACAFLAQGLLPENAFKVRFGLLCVAASASFGSIPPLFGWLSANIRGTGAVGLAIAINTSLGGMY
ncbi:putative transporter C1002,16c [Rhizoctonia solani AG-1 IB]|uniref:Putative transporter C1002,16c n=1 Tax=Thanatephorus cucumeris (strain AG1-IB / isolate 7/3/14) TaxID=1108050 RepID=M5CCY5_THACB|nr:putative transporter C1002,16c [Rhizoctonia solani AG-1 IB]